MGPYKSLCVLMVFSWTFCVLISHYKSLWVFIRFYRSLCVLWVFIGAKDLNAFFWVFMGPFRSFFVLMDSNEFLLVFISTHAFL